MPFTNLPSDIIASAHLGSNNAKYGQALTPKIEFNVYLVVSLSVHKKSNSTELGSKVLSILSTASFSCNPSSTILGIKPIGDFLNLTPFAATRVPVSLIVSLLMFRDLIITGYIPLTSYTPTFSCLPITGGST